MFDILVVTCLTHDCTTFLLFNLRSKRKIIEAKCVEKYVFGKRGMTGIRDTTAYLFPICYNLSLSFYEQISGVVFNFSCAHYSPSYSLR